MSNFTCKAGVENDAAARIIASRLPDYGHPMVAAIDPRAGGRFVAWSISNEKKTKKNDKLWMEYFHRANNAVIVRGGVILAMKGDMGAVLSGLLNSPYWSSVVHVRSVK